MQIQKIKRSFELTEEHKNQLQSTLLSTLGSGKNLTEYIYLAFELGASITGVEPKKLCKLVQKVENGATIQTSDRNQ